MESRESKLLSIALKSTDYRGFIAAFAEATAKKGGKPNYSALSRKAGFSSRGFIKEVIDGRRRLTARSMPGILKALSLPTQFKSYFNLLVMLEEEELNLDRLSRDQITTRLEELRAKLVDRATQRENSAQKAQAFFKSNHIQVVYAVLGNRNPGITVDEIVKRTELDRRIVENVIHYLLGQGIVRAKNGRYTSMDPHVFFQGLGEEHGFKASFLESLNEMRLKANAKFKSDDKLFAQSYFSVNRHRLPELKKRMSELIMEFVETNENDDGDCVGKLIVGLYS